METQSNKSVEEKYTEGDTNSTMGQTSKTNSTRGIFSYWFGSVRDGSRTLSDGGCYWCDHFGECVWDD